MLKRAGSYPCFTVVSKGFTAAYAQDRDDRA